MPRRILGSLAATAIASAGSAAPAVAQHHHHQSGHHHHQSGHHHHYQQPTHYHVQPNHCHVPTYIQPPAVYVQPPTVYAPPARTTCYRVEDHSHDHADIHAPRQIAFGGFSHVDGLVAELEGQANDLCLELHYNYRHNPGFRQVYKEAYEILTTAQYIHGLEHTGTRDRLRQAAGELDGLFHHVDGHVSSWSGHHHRQIGYGGLTTKLEAVERTLQRLMDDVGVRPAAGGQAPPASTPVIQDAPIGLAPRGYDPGAAPPGSYVPRSYSPSGPAPSFESAPRRGDDLGPPPSDAPPVVPN